MSTPSDPFGREHRNVVVALVLHQLEVESDCGRGRAREHGAELLTILLVQLRERRLELLQQCLHVHVARERRQRGAIRERQRGRILVWRRVELPRGLGVSLDEHLPDPRAHLLVPERLRDRRQLYLHLMRGSTSR